ncbi:MAG: methyltransferase domain-containing protein [Deltaproteobacteria bacterium]|jgi:SAM-dependent methyltransferase|nr:methyltransferase domain-containing protein [Deltaproteobacteria bacterium]
MGTKEIEAKIGSFWDDYAHKFDAEHNTEDPAAWAEAFKGCLGAGGPSTILDLGTGTGFLANMAAAMGHFCLGLDIADRMLGIAVEKSRALGLRVVYLKGSVLDLPFPGDVFDYVVNARLLWTLVEPRKTIAHWVRFVRPGGRIVCFNRFRDGLGMCGGKDVYGDESVDGAVTLAHVPSSAELVGLFEGAGLTDVSFRLLPDLTKAEHREGLDSWHALIGTKPRAR